MAAGVLAVAAPSTPDSVPNAVAPWQPANGDWPMFRMDAARTGATAANATMKMAYYKWACRTTSSATMWSSPAVATVWTTSGGIRLGPKVFVGAHDSRFYCIEGATGQTVWRFQTGAAIWSSPAVGDINADGSAEVIFTSEDGRLYAVNAQNGSLLWRFTTRSALYSSPALADLTGDGMPEIVFGGADGNIYAMRGDGTRLWTYLYNSNSTGGLEASPAVGDINADGAPEVVISVGNGLLLALKGSDGSRLWTFNTDVLGQYGGGGTTAATLADVDNDGAIEVVAPIGGILCVLNGKDGAVEWHYTAMQIRGEAAVADGDGDGVVEVYIGTLFEQTFLCLNGETGNVEWSRTIKASIWTAPALADLDGDKKMEAVFSADDRILRAVNAEDGSPAWAYPTPKAVMSSPSIGDIDTDGKAEVVFSCSDGRVYALDYNF
jgi:outer membrane protein assembly factor BamB